MENSRSFRSLINSHFLEDHMPKRRLSVPVSRPRTFVSEDDTPELHTKWCEGGGTPALRGDTGKFIDDPVGEALRSDDEGCNGVYDPLVDASSLNAAHPNGAFWLQLLERPEDRIRRLRGLDLEDRHDAVQMHELTYGMMLDCAGNNPEDFAVLAQEVQRAKRTHRADFAATCNMGSRRGQQLADSLCGLFR